MVYNTISFKTDGSVRTLYLDRPDSLNALSKEMRLELVEFMRNTEVDETVKALILTGKGRAFCAGGDLNAFKTAYEAYERGEKDEGFRGLDFPRAFIQFPKPIIAAINGAAYGFGLTVTLTCDIRLASERAVFSCAFARIGVTPEFGSSYFLPRLIGYGKAAELALTARRFDAFEAERLGLVNRVVKHDELLSEAEKLAAEISALPPETIKMTKALLRRGAASSPEQALEYESVVFQQRTGSSEHYEAVCRVMEEIRNSKARK